MRDLFDRIKAEGEPAIKRLVEEQRQESVDLEFKRKHDSTNGEAAREDKENLGSVLSAFSNSMGGLLIWGVEARKTGDGIDCAIELQPISAIARFESDVGRRAAEALMPRHEGIEIASVRCADDPNRGYLLVLVERSERRPHRCEFKGVKQYYKRIGDNTFAMEHYDIKDAFKRITVPELDIEYDLQLGVQDSGTQLAFPRGNLLLFVYINIWLKNQSPVSGHSPYLIAECHDFNLKKRLSYHPCSGLIVRGNLASGGVDAVIHPELPLLAMVIRYGPIPACPINGHYGKELDSLIFSENVAIPPVIRLSYRCGCFNSRQKVGTIEIFKSEILCKSDRIHVLE